MKDLGTNRKLCEGKLFPTNSGHVFLVRRYINNKRIIGNFIGSSSEVVASYQSLRQGMIKHPADKKLILEGTIFESKYYGEFFIKRYNSNTNVLVEFLNTKSRTKTTIKACRSGSVKDYEAPTVYGVGFIGLGEYRLGIGSDRVVRKAYSKWSNMLRRVYVSDHITKDTTYENCVVDYLWLNFQNFARWYVSQSGGDCDMELDKDLLIKGNKLYSPYTCTLLPKEINTTLTKNDKNRSIYGIGVSKRDGKSYRSNSKQGKTYDNPRDAYIEYKTCKENRLKLLAEKYKTVISREAYNSLLVYQVEAAD